LKSYGDIDSKFRYVILAAKRAKQLLKGAPPKIKTKSKNLIRVAQEEVKNGLIDYELVAQRTDDVHNSDDDIFIGEELGENIGSLAEELPEISLLEKIGEEVKKKG